MSNIIGSAIYNGGLYLTQSDEGKVVSNGALVTQTTRSSEITGNGTYDTTLNDEVVVNVSGGIDGVYKGTSIPNSSVGLDNDIYIKNVPLPSSINYVEYLESTGTQYILTNIYGSVEMQATLDFQTTTVTNGGIFVARASKSSRAFDVTMENGKVRFDLNASESALNNISTNTENKLVLGRISINNSLSYYAFSTSTFTTPVCISLFGVNNNGSVSPNNIRIKRLTLKELGAVVADFLPAIDGNNVPCMYEAVSGTYYYNQGSGNFGYGSSVTPKETFTVYQKRFGNWVVPIQIGEVVI